MSRTIWRGLALSLLALTLLPMASPTPNVPTSGGTAEFTSNADSNAFGVTATSSGVFVAGSANMGDLHWTKNGASGYTTEAGDALLVKYTTGALTQSWSHIYDYDGGDAFNAVVASSSGSLFAAGYSIHDDPLLLVAKFNATGVEQWHYIAEGMSIAAAITLDGSGNVWVAGTAGTPPEYYVARFDPSTGSLTASCTFSYSSGEYTDGQVATGLSFLSGGDLAVSGIATHKTGLGYESQLTLTRLVPSSCSRTWHVVESNNAAAGRNAFAVKVDANDNLIIAGSDGCVANCAVHTARTASYSSSGTRSWEATYGGGLLDTHHNEQLSGIDVDSSRNIFVSGWDGAHDVTDNYYVYHVDADTIIPGAGSYNVTLGTIVSDFLTIKYNSAGTQQWATTFTNNGPGGSIEFYGNANALTSDASTLYVVGARMNLDPQNLYSHAYVLRYTDI